jgi:hypothetical protein
MNDESQILVLHVMRSAPCSQGVLEWHFPFVLTLKTTRGNVSFLPTLIITAASSITTLHVILLDVGNTGPTIGSHLGATGGWRLGFLYRCPGASNTPFLHVLLDVLAGQSEAGADWGIRIFGIDGPGKIRR